MGFKLFLQESLKGISQEELGKLPSGYQRIGDIVVLHIPKEIRGVEKEIGALVRERLGVKSVFRKGVVSGELRKPSLKRIAGRVNTTIHQENGCRFKIDVTKVMFSRGNSFERGRVIAGDGETVLDMFAGIGYFSIPLAKKTPSCNVVAVEKNPVAVKFLRENLRLNKLENVEVFQGDCRDVEGVKADRILMGYFPGTDAFLPAAFSFLRRQGVIHFHNLYRRGELWRGPLGTLETQALANGYRLERVLAKRIVKPYSPCKVHAVVDVRVKKT
ncbi:MAG: class I SAM-dependent methyltransferase family protein [Candidatus Aenigmarchaeota archaeon]|nr:class I SAM-dependent methyltransferase family protein [Candidatus Aenigmarchaeota archaeon]